MGGYSDSEKAAIKQARELYPNEGQRGLAGILYDHYNKVNHPGFTLRNRSRQSIYGALRRHDNQQAVANTPAAAATA